MNVIANRMVMG